MTTLNTFPPDLLSTFITDNSEEYLKKTYESKGNRHSLASWFCDQDRSLEWIKAHTSLSLKFLKVISRACTPEEYLQVEKIYSIFRESVLMIETDQREFNTLSIEFIRKFFQEDPTRFKQYLMTPDSIGWTPLHYATAEGDLDFISFIHVNLPSIFDALLEKNANGRQNLLFIALKSQNLEILKYFHKNCPKIFIQFLESKFGKWERTPLLEATAIGYLDFFSFVHQNYSELYTSRLSMVKCKSGLSCLHWAALKKHDSICDYIKSTDPEIFNCLLKSKDQSDFTPLHYAIQSLNSVFVKKIAVLKPSFFAEFFSKSEPAIFRKILLENQDNEPRHLLSDMILNDEFELFDLIRKKEPLLFFELLENAETSGCPHPLKIAFENQRKSILDLLYTYAPVLFQKLNDYEFVSKLFSTLGEKSTLILTYCNNYPATGAMIKTLIHIKKKEDWQAIECIKANLALTHAKQYFEYILQSQNLINFLNIHEDVVTKWLSSLPDLEFISWESALDILIQLPPTEIKNTMDNISPETIEEIVDTNIFVKGDLDMEGSYQCYWWVLQMTHERYHQNLDDENFFAAAHEDLKLIGPQGFAAACIHGETQQIVKQLLRAIPEPHYRAVVPLLSTEEFETFISPLSFAEKLNFLRVATAEQKHEYLKNLTLENFAELSIWNDEMDLILEELNTFLENQDIYDKQQCRSKYEELRQTWVQGQKHLTLLAKEEASAVKLVHNLTIYDNTADITLLINTKLKPFIKQVKEINKSLKVIRTIIWEKLNAHPLLQVQVIPDEFLCPITGDIIKSPMRDKYGQNYEEELILEWVREKGTSPMTRQPLTVEDLTHNPELKARIEEFFRIKNSEENV